ncbi:unnamed protein product, partial [Didymodactylos carnosus]
ENVYQWTLYILNRYGNHPAFYRTDNYGLFYIYDSYQINTDDWRAVLLPNGKKRQPIQALYIGLLLKQTDCEQLLYSGFDGAYTYFAADRFTEGSTMSNWINIKNKCNSIQFIPSVGPGYIDVRVRPWNSETFRHRSNGSYYINMFQMGKRCLSSDDSILTITSFNEWHEGTQIEPSVKMFDPLNNFTYKHYHHGPFTYISLTRQLIFSTTATHSVF